ncbi:MAG: hypothetical protein Q8O23_01620 [Gallionella sp.]|nr:hypothetical protein [Gallionella sp.]
MKTLDKRLSRLEAKPHADDVTVIDIHFVRPGDMAVVSEVRLETGKEPVWIHRAEPLEHRRRCHENA